ncbi:hypothetical protein [Roseiconus lacunae]|uniref:hypothetical protein n=1 Tax=Roseiconus lacunae TaxID=2605694 RepID=UPI0011F2EFFD
MGNAGKRFGEAGRAVDRRPASDDFGVDRSAWGKYSKMRFDGAVGSRNSGCSTFCSFGGAITCRINAKKSAAVDRSDVSCGSCDEAFWGIANNIIANVIGTNKYLREHVADLPSIPFSFVEVQRHICRKLDFDRMTTRQENGIKTIGFIT